MKSFVNALIYMIAIAFLTHGLLVMATPRLIMRVALFGMNRVAGTNAMYHAPLPNADSRSVVRPSPDIAYSVCVFDLSQGPVSIQAPVGDSYTSLAVYAANTDNIFAISDSDVTDGVLRVRIVEEDASENGAPDTHVVRSPTARGIVMLRAVVTDPSHFQALDGLRRTATCQGAT